jgi:predicted O-methyltransferase YrrM
MMGARERILEMVNAAWTTQVIGAACELRLPDLLATGPRRAVDVAAAATADADAVRRMLRALTALGLCHEHEDGTYSLTDDGGLLTRGSPQSLGTWAEMSARRLWDNWGGLADSVRTGRSASSRREATDTFTALGANEEKARQFHGAMVDLTRPVAIAAARQIDWDGVGTIVDVGGGAGALAAIVLAHHPAMRGIVFDLPHALEAARALMREAGVSARCEVQGGDFFAALPGDADAYLLKSVLHDWDDERAARILDRCAAAMAPGARVIVIEREMPERVSGGAARDTVRSDLNMLVGCGGRERTRADFQALFRAAGLDFRYALSLTPDFNALVAVR